MSNIPLPALSAQAPQQPDILGQAAKLQTAQSNALDLQMKQRDLQDQQTVMQVLGKHRGDLESALPELAGSVSAKTFMGLDKYNRDRKKESLELDEKTRDQKLAVNGQKLGLIEQAQQLAAKDPQAYAQAFPQIASQMIDLDPRLKGRIDPSTPVPPEMLDKFKIGLMTDSTYEAKAKAQSEIGKNNAQAAQASAEAGLKNQETKFYEGSGMGAPGVPPEVAQMSDALKRGVIKNPSEWPAYKAKQDAVATFPEKLSLAKAEGQARASIEAQVARGSNAALAQVPPHLVAPASSAATKVGEDYAQAQSVTQRLNAMMDAARKGNVVAYQVMPEEGTLQITTSQGVHRINQAEIQQYAGGGSLWQRLMGHVGKALSGKSIPDSVLSDMADIQKIQSEGSQLKYNNALKTINQTYGAKFEPVQMDEMKSVEGAGAKKGAGDPLGIR
jgi:hypothetical protein